MRNLCNTYFRRTTDRAFDFLIGRKHSRKDRQVKVSFRKLKAQIYWPTTDQKVQYFNILDDYTCIRITQLKDDLYALAMDLDVLLPFHRVDKYFKDAIDSLSNTQGISFNVILIDDRLDKSENILKLLNPLKNFIIVETEGQQGYGLALKAGSSHIKADSVALFNSDDLMHPLRFKKQLQKLETSDLNFTRMNRINSLGKLNISLAGETCSSNYDPIYLIFGSYGANATWCMKSTWWHKNVFFDDKACLDWRIALKTFYKTNVSFTPEYLYSYRKHENQITNQKNVSKNYMLPVFNDWNDFLVTQNLASYSYETFLSIAAPWITPGPLSKVEIKKFYMDISNQLPAVSTEVAKDLRALIQKRMIFSLRAKSDIGLKTWLSFNGKNQILSITRDLIIRKLGIRRFGDRIPAGAPKISTSTYRRSD